MKTIFSRSAFAASILFLAFAGCAVALSEAGSTVKLMKSDPPSECQELGEVRGRATASGGALDPAATLEQSKNALRNKAAEMGANYVRWEAGDSVGGVVTGTAYRCPTSVSK